MKAGWDVDSDFSLLGSVVMGSFHWLSCTGPHLRWGDHPSCFLPAGEKKNNSVQQQNDKEVPTDLKRFKQI